MQKQMPLGDAETPLEAIVPLLEAKEISKSFGSVDALSDVNLQLQGGTVHAVIGHNGAGKSTLMKIISGAEQPSSGELRLQGRPVIFASPRRASAEGVNIVHQELSVLEDLSVAENIVLGREPRKRMGWLDRASMTRRAQEIIGKLRLNVPVDALCRNLNVGERQMVEIARALSSRCSVLILDEPTAALSVREQDALFELILRLKADGIGIIYISHRLDEIIRLADVVSVLRDGRNVGEAQRGAFDHSALVQMMVGRSIIKTVALGGNRGGEALSVEGLTSRSSGLKDINLRVAKGEIIGLAGMLGSGRSELFECLFGLRRFESGTIRLDGKPVSPNSPLKAMEAGLGLVPEDRKNQGIFAEAPLWRNISIASIRDRFARGWLVDEGAARRDSADQITKLRIRCSSPSQPMSLLSGGNQQKAILARWITRKPKVLLLDEPTAGIDIGAKSEIYDLARSLAGDGMGLLIASSEFDELIGLCHRILVMRNGAIVQEVDGRNATEHGLAVAATGGESD